MRPTRAGRMRHRLTLERDMGGDDGHGGQLRDWQTVREFWGFVRPLRGTEQLEADRLEASVTHRIHCRYMSDIDPRDRIVFRGRSFNIRQIIDVEEWRRELDILCEEGVAT